MRVAVAQARPALLNLEEGVARALHWIDRAARNGAELVVFGETFLGGYPAWVDWPGWSDFQSQEQAIVYARQVQSSIDLSSDDLLPILIACKEHSIAAVIGASVRSESGKSIYNAALTIDATGHLRQARCKLQPTHGERLCWAPAPDADRAGLNHVALGDAKITTLMCWEHWMPHARAAIRATGETLHIACWPHGSDLHQLCSRHYAFEGGCFVLLSALFSPREDFVDAGLHPPDSFAGLTGGSAIIAPDTTYISEPVFDREDLLLADLDLTTPLAAAFRLDTAGHYDRPDLFKPIPDGEDNGRRV